MEPIELKLKNLIEIEGSIYPVNELYFGNPENLGGVGVLINGSVSWYGFEAIQPISLNEEWLSRTQFKKLNNFHWSKLVNKGLPPFYIEVQGIEATNNIHYRLIVKGQPVAVIRYLHTLQNVFFALSDQEIEIKELAK